MPSQKYVVSDLKQLMSDIFILHVKPQESSEIFSFQPGQFCELTDPSYIKPEEAHPFSIASSPTSKDHLEFCFRTYGEWTTNLSKRKIGDAIGINGPLGKFTFHDEDENIVFLVGGIGIAPIMSMLRFIAGQKQKVKIVLIYGSRTPDAIVYKSEIDELISQIDNCKVIHILSDIGPEESWPGYRGFVTKEILQKEVDFTANPAFYLSGPPIFVEKMNELLKEFSVNTNRIRQEVF